MKQTTRRQFVSTSAGILGGTGALLNFPAGVLPKVSAQEANTKLKLVEFDSRIEPLVRLIEESPRETVIEKVAERIRAGAAYREILAALLLAGIRNVQPRPEVGFKFHCVLVVNSCYLASLSGPDEDRWLPILWAIDYFKSSQAEEKRSSGWRMPAVVESAVPDAEHSKQLFVEAMETWDVEKADTATAGLVRTAGANEVFELFAAYAARDYRSIGHKAIYLANTWRTLQVIGMEFAEPALRSLAFAILNHTGDPNPSTSDLDVDRPWRKNQELIARLPANWLSGTLDAKLTEHMLSSFRTETPQSCAEIAADGLAAGVAPQSIWDGVFVSAGELLMRQPGIIGLHGLTTANAMHYLWRTTSNEPIRQRLLLQACSFNPLFRESAKSRGQLSDATYSDISQSAPAAGSALPEIMRDITNSPKDAAAKLLGYLQSEGSPQDFVDESRRTLFAKGSDAHDYKFSSAVLEDYSHVSPNWRNHFMSLSVFNLKGTGHRDSPLLSRTREALASS